MFLMSAAIYLDKVWHTREILSSILDSTIKQIVSHAIFVIKNWIPKIAFTTTWRHISRLNSHVQSVKKVLDVHQIWRLTFQNVIEWVSAFTAPKFSPWNKHQLMFVATEQEASFQCFMMLLLTIILLWLKKSHF